MMNLADVKPPTLRRGRENKAPSFTANLIRSRYTQPSVPSKPPMRSNVALLSRTGQQPRSRADNLAFTVPTIESTKGRGRDQVYLERRFNQLADTWEKETGFLSSTAQKFRHKAYVEIENMGSIIVPLILERLEKRSGHWLVLLNKLTGFEPKGKTNSDRIADWLEYGRKHRLI